MNYCFFGRIGIATGDDYLNSTLTRLSYFIEPHIFSLNHGNKYELFSNERTGKNSNLKNQNMIVIYFEFSLWK